jgi:tellurite resistance protein TerC
MTAEFIFFSLFLVFIFLVLSIDLGLFQKEAHIVSFKEASIWTGIWFTFSIGFYFFLVKYAHIIHGIETLDQILYFNELYKHKIDFSGLAFDAALAKYNKTISLQYLTGYFIEYSLSADNLFVILLIFKSFSVSRKYYKKILVWGILGAVVMRFSFIFLGAALVSKFHWILYLFGAFLIFSGLKMLFTKDKDDEILPENHPMVKFVSKFFKVYPKNFKGKLLFKHPENRKWHITPLFVVLLVVEFSDLIFAVDSVPAIFSITLDPYIVFFANIFAILGLRSLFFLLERVVSVFHFLGYGLSILLMFIGFKLIFEEWLHSVGFTQEKALLVIVGILAISIILSLVFPKKEVDAGA